MANQVCFAVGVGSDCVRLIQTGIDRFTVEYGKQKEVGLSYYEAAAELGAALMHRAALEGRLDNRNVDEAAEDGDSEPVFG